MVNLIKHLYHFFRFLCARFFLFLFSLIFLNTFCLRAGEALDINAEFWVLKFIFLYFVYSFFFVVSLYFTHGYLFCIKPVYTYEEGIGPYLKLHLREFKFFVACLILGVFSHIKVKFRTFRAFLRLIRLDIKKIIKK